VIDVDEVALQFSDVGVLSGANLRVDPGEFVALVGPNGAGKTTLLRTVNAVLAADSGSVRLDGDPVSTLSTREVSRRVATVPQDTHLGFAFTAEQIVEMGRTPHRSRIEWGTQRDPVEAAMERTETGHLAGRTVDDLSGGERQRVLVARALAQDTPALLLDEPTASLDINHQVRVLDLARDLADEGRAVLAAIHDLDLAARFCDRLALLHEGRIRTSGRPAAVLDSELVDAAFETTTAVTDHPVTGTPTVAAFQRDTDRGATVHVAGHGPGAAHVLGVCWAAGFDVSLGIVPSGDVAAVAADGIGIPVVTTDPFDEPAAETRSRAAELLARADVCLRVAGAAVPDRAGRTRPPVVGLEPGGSGGPDRRAVIDAVLAGLGRQTAAADD
jgi:iron complex transport system ATP-binding protein